MRPGIGQIKRGPKWGGTDKQNTVECGNDECTVTQKHLYTSFEMSEVNPRTGRLNNSSRPITNAMVYDWLLICGWSPSKSKLVCMYCSKGKEVKHETN
jgi:hypothetical protein